jgi:magnesium-transporting ATPase (P-type)
MLLCKVKNQSPLLGTSILLSLLIILNFMNVVLAIYAPRKEYSLLNPIIYYGLFFVINVLMYLYANKKKHLIIKNNIVPKWKDWTVFLLFVVSTICFIYLVNINRQKIFSNRKAKYPTEQPIKQNSLESKLRDWWNN